jgi:nucleotide-binding universal stress UspA family protein
MDKRKARPRIVVGIDGSEQANAALQVAYEEARVRAGELVVVHAWTYSSVGSIRGHGLDAATDLVEWALAGVSLAADGDVEIVRRVVGGDPRGVLEHAAQEAALVVVGSRGRGRIASPFLGSVSSHVVHHSRCPVEVVPDRPGPDCMPFRTFRRAACSNARPRRLSSSWAAAGEAAWSACSVPSAAPSWTRPCAPSSS